MQKEITRAEQRLLAAICENGPLPSAAVVLTRALAMRRDSISLCAKELELKGLCTRERQGMRLYLRPTAAGIEYVRVRRRPHDQDAPVNAVTVAFTTERAPKANLPDSQEDLLAAAARAQGPVATSRLAELTGLTYGAAHRQARRLYGKGYFARTCEDRRWLWSLTYKGRSHLQGWSTPISARASR